MEKLIGRNFRAEQRNFRADQRTCRTGQEKREKKGHTPDIKTIPEIDLYKSQTTFIK